MPKAVISDLTSVGFRQEQFGDPADWSAAGGYLEQVLADASLEVQEAVGANSYAAATAGTLKYKRMRRAEVYFSAAELWRRIEQFERSNAQLGRESQEESTASRALANAERYDQLAMAEIRGLTGSDLQSGVAIGYVETGHFAEVAP